MKDIFKVEVREESDAMKVVYDLLKLVGFDKYKTYNWFIHHVCGGEGLCMYVVSERNRYELRIERKGESHELTVFTEQEAVETLFTRFLTTRFPSPAV